MKEKTGLVIEGGGVRGIYAAGVLDVFLREGITFDGLIGVSAGAIHGCSYLSGQQGRSLRYYKKYLRDPRFISFRSLLKTGNIVGTDFCYHELPDVLDPYDYEAFLNNPTPFYVTVSNLRTGRAEYKRIRDMRAEVDLMRASASLPFVSQPVEWQGEQYLDGGICDSIPVEAFMELGYGRNVVILTREAAYRKEEKKNSLAKLKYRKYPAFYQAIHNRPAAYNRTLERIGQLEREGVIFVIRPESPLPAGRMEKDVDKMQATYDRGVRDAEKSLRGLREFLGL